MSLHRTKNIEQRTLRSISCRADVLPTNFLNLYPNNHLPPQAATVFNNCLWLLSTNVLKENAVHSRELLLVFFLLIPYLFPITKDNRNDFQNKYFKHWAETAFRGNGTRWYVWNIIEVQEAQILIAHKNE